MTWSSTKQLLTPFENPKQVLRSRRKLFDTSSLVESNSLEFDQLSKIEEHIEEVTEKMTETIEQYMSNTRGDYGSGVTRPSISQDTHFELKVYLFKELRDNTFSGSEYKDVNEHIEKVLEIVDLFHIPKVTQDQIMLRAFHKWHNGTSSKTISTETSDGLAAIQAQLNNLRREIKKFGAPYQTGGQYRAAGSGFYQQNNEISLYPDRRPSLEKSLTKFMAESAKRHEENSNIIKEIRASTDAAIGNQGASIKILEIQIGQMSKVLQERGFGSLSSSTEINPRDQVKSISTAKADFSRIHRIGCGPYAVLGIQHKSLFSETVPFPG
nr:hypothetical protein [Tanacetum cinerariifolium]